MLSERTLRNYYQLELSETPTGWKFRVTVVRPPEYIFEQPITVHTKWCDQDFKDYDSAFSQGNDFLKMLIEICG